MVLTETLGISGLGAGLSRALARWRKPLATHDPAKVLTDLAVTLSLGGDCLADIAVLREAPAVYGLVASDPTVSRTIAALAQDAPAALAAIDTARAAARARVWEFAGERAPGHDATAENPLIIDMDATLVTAHSEKENAGPAFKRGYGFHPLWAFVDHGPAGSGSRWRACCAPVTPGRTPQPTTSPWPVRRWRSYPVTHPPSGRRGPC